MRRPGAVRAIAEAVGSLQAAAALLAAGALLAVLLPLPPIVVDLLLALNLGAAVGVLLVALVTPEPGRLTSLPPVLVLTSLARIVLCLCVSRLVLVTGEGGALVLTLGRTLSGGDAIAGVGLLVVLAVVHLAMVTAGVGRMSEVAARFALDAMPGKQMGLDSALGRGQVSAAEAREQVRALEQEANFYGAMDGAGRLLRGEAVVTVVIVALTAIGGAARALDSSAGLADVAERLALTAAGQGLVIILPALLMGAAAALVVSRSASGSGLIEEAREQMLGSFWPPAAAAVALLGLGLLPGMAKAPTLIAAAALAAGAWWLGRGRAQATAAADGRVAEQVPADELVVEVGLGLLDLMDEADALLPALRRAREEISAELGFALPALTVRDSVALRATQYSFAFRGQPLERGTVRPRRLLAVPPTAGVMPDVGRPGEVGDGRSGVWVTEEEAGSLGTMHYRLLGPVEVMGEHLRFTLRRHAAELFDLQAASRLLRHTGVARPEVVAEARDAGLTASLLRQTCGRLLEAGLPLRDLLSVTEAIAEALPATSDPESLALRCRPHLTGLVCARLIPPESGRVLRAVELAPGLEDELEQSAHRRDDRTLAALPAERTAAWTAALNELAREHGWGRPLAVVCRQGALLPLLDLCRQVPVELVPLAAGELPPGITVQFVARLDPQRLL